MSKKKAVVCTVLFAIMFFGLLIGTCSIEVYDGSFNLFNLISGFITGMWASNCVEKFYKWIIR